MQPVGDSSLRRGVLTGWQWLGTLPNHHRDLACPAAPPPGCRSIPVSGWRSHANAGAVVCSTAGGGRGGRRGRGGGRGVVESNHLNFSGTGFVNYDNLTGSYVQWTVSAASAGTAKLSVRHANGSTANRPMDITVNGTVVAAGVAFNPTGSWDTWATVTVNAAVNAGTNAVRATATTASGGPNVDFLDVEVAAPSNDYQAEDATISQGTVATNHLGYTGTGFVDYTNVTGSYVEFSVTAGATGPASLTFRHA